MAGHQLAGRGRGKNGWLSSSGCLQFSMVLRHPHPSTTLTLIQYLVAVAMVEAVKGLCAGEVVVPLKLKWPNDLLALSKDAMTGQVSMRKIGGILVTSETSAVADEHQLVIGTFFEHIIANAKLGFGFNVRDTPWSVSLADLVGSVPSKEAVLAAYLATFERLYERMNAVGFPFDLYYSHWLHKDQIVFLESEQVKAQIQGIDKNGYLMAKPLHGKGNILLQPDGNSFDMMKNLIHCKQ